MSSRLDQLEAELQRLRNRVAELEAGRLGGGMVIPGGISAGSAKLLTLARLDPAAAKAEALRISRLDNQQRRERRRQCGSNIDAA